MKNNLKNNRILRVFHFTHYKLDTINQVSYSGLKTAISGFCLEKNYGCIIIIITYIEEMLTFEEN